VWTTLEGTDANAESRPLPHVERRMRAERQRIVGRTVC